MYAGMAVLAKLTLMWCMEASFRTLPCARTFEICQCSSMQASPMMLEAKIRYPAIAQKTKMVRGMMNESYSIVGVLKCNEEIQESEYFPWPTYRLP